MAEITDVGRANIRVSIVAGPVVYAGGGLALVEFEVEVRRAAGVADVVLECAVGDIAREPTPTKSFINSKVG